MKRLDGQPARKGNPFNLSRRMETLKELQAKIAMHTNAAAKDLVTELEKTYDNLRMLTSSLPESKRMERPGTKIDWMLIVMSQKQGLGKTSMPALVFKQNSLTLYGEQNDKDLHMKLHSALVIGFDELDSFGKKESSFLKAMITTAQDHFRPPYGASVEVFDRRCILYGCGNRHEFLQSDPSGYRRYAVVEVGQKLDFAGLEGELDQLWAEAWAIYSEGKTAYWEIEGANAEAEKYVVPSEIEEDIRDYVEKLKMNSTNIKDGYAYLKYSLMAKSLQGQRLNPREVAAVLRKLGAEKKSSRGPYGGSAVADWWLIPLDK